MNILKKMEISSLVLKMDYIKYLYRMKMMKFGKNFSKSVFMMKPKKIVMKRKP